MSRTKEFRIKHTNRKKREARLRTAEHGYKPTPTQVGIMATTPALRSSSSCCSNPRRDNGEHSKTVQERKHCIDPQEVIIPQSCDE